MLLVSELVTNAVRHAARPITLEVIRENSHDLQVRARDAGRGVPVPADRGPDDESGRGLALTEILSDAWGVDVHPHDGTTVWFRIVTPT